MRETSPLTSDAHNGSAAGGQARVRRRATRQRVSLAVIFLALFTFVVVGRIVEIFPSLHLAFIFGGVTGVLALLLPRSGRPGLLKSNEVRAVVGLLGLAALTIPFSLWPGGSLSHVLNLHVKMVILFLLLAHCVRSPRDVNVAVWGLLGGIAVIELWVFLFNQKARAQVTSMYDPNDLAFVMVCAIPLAASLAIHGRGIARYLAGLIASAGVAVVVLTTSRAGFVGIVLVGLVMLARLWHRRPLFTAALLLVSLVVFASVASEGYWGRVGTIWGAGTVAGPGAEYDREGLKAARLKIWETGLRMALEHPILGVGAGSFVIAEAATHGGRGRWQSPHNSFLQVAGELGLGGLALFVFLLYATVRICRTVIRRAKRDPQLRSYLWLAEGLEVSLYGFVIVGFTLQQAYSPILYFLLGMSVALKRLTACKSVPERDAPSPASPPAPIARSAQP